MSRIKVIVYGMFPKLLPTHLALGIVGKDKFYDSLRSQLDEYPEKFVDTYMFLTELLAELYRYGSDIKIEVVNVDSARGVWYAFKYRLSDWPAVIIGDRVFRGDDLSPVRLRKYIENLLNGE